MFYIDRLLEGFRSLYAQRPAQSSVLGRTVYNAEEEEYAHICRIASKCHDNLAQNGISERIPGVSVQSVNTSTSAYPILNYIYRGRMFVYSFSISLFMYYSTLFQEVGTCSRSAEGYRCLLGEVR